MNKEGPLADRPSILLARRKEDKGAICMDGKAQPGLARTGWAGQEGEACPWEVSGGTN